MQAIELDGRGSDEARTPLVGFVHANQNTCTSRRLMLRPIAVHIPRFRMLVVAKLFVNTRDCSEGWRKHLFGLISLK